ncbi:hypothetical protein [Paenibacillus chibensis]|uniref:hypothetical protein n=1 Tax=Paenibacillus chibensis TaxID=59846 RepID=UPI0013E37AA8|nr:hypothetical protein [Paenibacillus chibensis]MEC0370010.1 hypothetical protein [Paenibacillus chibensis]
MAEPSTTKYREVKRKASVGERIRIVAAKSTRDLYANGDELTVDDADRWGDGQAVTVNSFNHAICHEEYVVLVAEPLQPKRLTVGDYAKVIANTRDHNYKIGSVVKITKDDRDRQPYRAENADGSVGNWLAEKDLVPATEAEFNAQKSQTERAKAIGEFADGGYAQIIDANSSNSSVTGGIDGKYVKVTVEPPTGYRALRLKDEKGKHVAYCNADALRKITKEEYEEATKPKTKFSVGDTVKLSVPEGKDARFGWGNVKNGDIGKVAEVTTAKVVVDFPGQDRWNADPSELALLTAEEAKWAAIGRKVNEFKRGDVVQIIANTNGSINKVGSYGEVTEGPKLTGSYRVETGAGGKGNLTRPTEMRLIIPAEQRFDTQKEAA